MKWLFALLVAANLALFMWGKWYHEPLVDPAVPRPQPGVAEEKLKLLSEPGVRLIMRTRDTLRPSPAPAEPVAAVACYRLGPFAGMDAAVEAGGKLEARGLHYERVAELETGPPAYHVYLPPFPSKQAAERKRRELTRLGFTDHAVIQEEGLENGISLGVFTVEQNARARLGQLARKGVRASMRAVPNVQQVYWLTLSLVGDDTERAPVTGLEAEEWGGTGVRLHPVPCNAGRAAPTTSPDEPAAD